MKVKTTELTKLALDWAVSQIENPTWTPDEHIKLVQRIVEYPEDFNYRPSENWEQGGEIIERERIAIWQSQGEWFAEHPHGEQYDAATDNFGGPCGPTPLVASMRCWVEEKLGDEVDIPDELAVLTPT